GIVGLPNVGKSTLFNALTKNNILAANYPFATIEPNVGVISVPDQRLLEISKLYPGSPIVPADVRFVDIAGLVAGASKGEGLGNQFLANIREASAIVHVVRAFDDSNVVHVDNDVNPVKDIETINTELVLADLETVTKRLELLHKSAKSNPQIGHDIALFEELKQALDKGELIKNFVQNQDIEQFLESSKLEHDNKVLISQLLTAKPMLLVFNVDEDTLGNNQKLVELKKSVGDDNPIIFICAKLEEELQNLSEEEAAELLSEYNQTQSGLSQLIKEGYEMLGLQSFFTAGEKEIRAWTIKKGHSAPEAAGVIHGDFQRGFIAAEVINWQDLVNAGSKTEARKLGKIRMEGKDYIMQDGDVVEFRFNI
ncbi:MAG: redox-regulated ATPase YchF, partial [Candidatus Saccharimonadales bacterium]